MNTRIPTLALAAIPLAASGASAAAWSQLEARLEAPGLATASTVQHTTWLTWEGPWDDGYNVSEFFDGPETTWGWGGHWAQTLMARPNPTTLTGRTERSQSPTTGFAAVHAITTVALQPGQTETFTLTLTDASVPDVPYQPYLPTDIDTGFGVRFWHTNGNLRTFDGAAYVRLFSTRGTGDPLLVRSVSVTNPFGWDTAAIASMLQSQWADGLLDSQVTFPMFSFTAPPGADSAFYEFDVFGIMSPSPGGVGLIGAVLIAASRRHRSFR